MAQNETKIKDKGMAKILVELKKLEDKPFVKTGQPAESKESGKAHEDGITNLDLAFIHEFGVDNIPERSHIRAAFDSARQELQALTDKLIGQIYDGQKTVEEALDIIGLTKEANIQKLVRAGLSPDLADSTKRARLSKFGKKGADPTPLIDTAQYINSIKSIKIMKKKGGL